MSDKKYPWVKYPAVGVCGLGCRLCPSYHSGGDNPCGGCKSEYRMGAGCPITNCALKKKGVEFCWECDANADCDKWKKHRASGKRRDSFKCYQTLETDIGFILEHGIASFEREQKERERLLRKMLDGYNDRRSKSYYCVAATVMEPDELKRAIARAAKESTGLDIKGKAKTLHGILDDIAAQKGYLLKLRK